MRCYRNVCVRKVHSRFLFSFSTKIASLIEWESYFIVQMYDYRDETCHEAHRNDNSPKQTHNLFVLLNWNTGGSQCIFESYHDHLVQCTFTKKNTIWKCSSVTLAIPIITTFWDDLLWPLFLLILVHFFPFFSCTILAWLVVSSIALKH